MNKEEDLPEIKSLVDTREHAVIKEMHEIYNEIEQKQKAWKDASKITCPDGCGACCRHFEPDLLECEALYLASWMIVNQRETAQKIAEGTFVSPHAEEADGCILFNPNSKYHCTVYGGRALICRLFGFSGDYGKDGKPRWKPCRFLPEETLEFHKISHRQYSEDEICAIFNALPPAMSDCVQQALTLSLSGIASETLPLREALPQAIRKLLMMMAFCGGSDNDNNDDNNNTPMSA